MKKRIVLQPAELLQQAEEQGKVWGWPRAESDGVMFSGKDGLWLSENPLPAWPAFSLSLWFRPYAGGEHEQRFFHCGTVNGPRFLLETRSFPEGTWCLDVFLAGEDGTSLVLIDKDRRYSENEWYTLRVEVTETVVKSFVNNRPNAESGFSYHPIQGGGFSLGVRQNKVSWFTGEVGEINIESIHS